MQNCVIKIIQTKLLLIIILTELPEMTIVFNTNYQLQYSQSYTTGRIHVDCLFEDVPYCMPLDSALQIFTTYSF
jgi:hypothetical protein